MVAFLDYLPRGNTLSDETWKRRHIVLQWVLFAHLPGLLVFGIARGYATDYVIEAVAAPTACLLVSRVLRNRRLASLAVTAGLVYCSAALVVLSGGSIEAHFHFFIMIGFIALYQDWVPFLWNVLFTIVSHGVGSWLMPGRIFDHVSGQHHPWTWSLIHGVAVLAGCAGVIVFWRNTEDEQRRSSGLRSELSESKRKRFTADLLVNLARRNQNLIYRQLDLLNRLEEHERDAEQLAHLFQLDHLATRIRRNAESLLVLSGEEPARKWGRAVLLVDVVRAAIAEIEELDRVDFAVDESLAVSGRAVADGTHLFAELIENAVHFSPPGLSVMIRIRAYLPQPGAHVLTIEDWGVGMSQTDLAEANDLLRRPRDVDLATSRHLGLHVVARLAQRYGIAVSLESTPGGGVTAVAVLPASLFVGADDVEIAPGYAQRRIPVGIGGRSAVTGPPGIIPAAGSSWHSEDGREANGHEANGHGSRGFDTNGHGSRGSDPRGYNPNGHEANGHEANGHEANGHEANGHEANGHGSRGYDANGYDANGYDPTSFGRNGTRPIGPDAGRDAGPDAGPDPDDRSGEGTATAGTAGAGPGGHSDPGTSPGDRRGTGAGESSGHGATAAADGGWKSWWTRPFDRFELDGPAVDSAVLPGPAHLPPDAAHAVHRADSRDPTGDRHESGLARRTPQANLATELRRPAGSAQSAVGAQPPRPARDALQARAALSRFQATQRAARQAGQPNLSTDGETAQ